jgi:hypothetical protein
MVVVAVVEPNHAEVIDTPGANTSTHEPKFEKVARTSVLSDAATVIAAGTRAGE